MKVSLLIDTASPRSTVALYGRELVSQRQTDEQRQSAQRVLPLIDEVLRETGIALADLACVGVINGPGSFTGMRIGVAIAQGLGFANQLPVITVSSLAALAYSAFIERGGANWLVALRAREEEVYVGGFRCVTDIGIQSLVPEQVVSADERVALANILAEDESWALAGDVNADEFANLIVGESSPVARYEGGPVNVDAFAILVRQQLASGETFEPSAALPNYVKEQMQYG